ncbi:hypothetical protein BDA99DRAFT_533347 [Phascolomyces articulosus]|uniref:Uncharacterized protein n=1 Tax=Phascolomyces articulosus TaxID=60185 RepID=A0AAD5PIR8_9FUNG|nr:hypothetical protein BDA99DRAFT_533347 [Phascolomyces articulosus]
MIYFTLYASFYVLSQQDAIPSINTNPAFHVDYTSRSKRKRSQRHEYFLIIKQYFISVVYEQLQQIVRRWRCPGITHTCEYLFQTSRSVLPDLNVTLSFFTNSEQKINVINLIFDMEIYVGLVVQVYCTHYNKCLYSETLCLKTAYIYGHIISLSIVFVNGFPDS